jgi:hypothetical protein
MSAISPAMRWTSASHHLSLVVSIAVIVLPMQRQASSNCPSSAWARAKHVKYSGIQTFSSRGLPDSDPGDQHFGRVSLWKELRAHAGNIRGYLRVMSTRSAISWPPSDGVSAHPHLQRAEGMFDYVHGLRVFVEASLNRFQHVLVLAARNRPLLAGCARGFTASIGPIAPKLLPVLFVGVWYFSFSPAGQRYTSLAERIQTLDSHQSANEERICAGQVYLLRAPKQ